jgi:anthranilate synthase/aminodeoxychorismate synthase-like glutamine amidotransferase
MLLILDNYDSFVYNLARHMALAGWEYTVIRNDAITAQDIGGINPEAIVISPGPCTPAEAGICVETIQKWGSSIPILGVCLGHQCIGEAFGATTVRSNDPMHGKASDLYHDNSGLFQGLPNPMKVGRYHSLVMKKEEGKTPLRTTATNDDDLILAVEHEQCPIYGIQFHPESILTPHGMQVIKNFTELALDWNYNKRNAA